MPDQASPPLPTTVVFRGNASQLREPLPCSFLGGVMHLFNVRVEDALSYEQQWDHLLFNASLSEGVSSITSRAEPISAAPLTTIGTVSMAPSGCVRRARVAEGVIVGLQVGLADWFVQDACEQPLGGRWRAVNNAPDLRAVAVAHQMAAAGFGDGYDRLTLETLVLSLARHLGRAYGAMDRRRDDGWIHPAALKRVITLMRESPERPPSLGELAQVAGLGPSAFIRAFRGSVGSTPAAYGLRFRLNRARGMLRSGDQAIAEIAHLNGFSSSSHLISTFRRHYGVTPARWRDLEAE